MKKFLKIAVVVLALLAYLASALLAAAVALPSVGDVVFSFFFGSSYRKVGEAAFEAKGYPRTLAIYKAQNKPFLIVGPCLFHEDGIMSFIIWPDSPIFGKCSFPSRTRSTCGLIQAAN